MQRRKFIKNTGGFVLGIGVFGSIKWDGNKFIGDTPTTTDILGPFYRPGAPVRININPAGFSGELLHVSGTIYKEDGKTPFKNCLVEIWQCDQQLNYDNTSEEYKYRGKQTIGADGKYHFITAQPPGYPVRPGSDLYRPSHIHLRISGDGQQDLITQIYFKGDSLIENDSLASSKEAANRIMPVTRNNKNEKQVIFDIVMAKEFKPDSAVFQKVSGIYKMSDNSVIEFYKDGDLLFMKWDGQIREGLWYKGGNEFRGGMGNRTVRFEVQTDGTVKVFVEFATAVKKEAKEYKEFNLEGIKTFKYG